MYILLKLKGTFFYSDHIYKMAEGLKQDFCEIDGNLYKNEKNHVFIFIMY